MDPIHPILPQPINIPPVTEPPQVGRMTREDRRERRHEPREQDESTAERGTESDERADGDDRLHVDVTA